MKEKSAEADRGLVRLKEESHVRQCLIELPEDAADRIRIQNLLGGRFLTMYADELHSHRANQFLPDVHDLIRGTSPFPSILEVAESFSREELGDATGLLDPVLLLYPPTKTRSDLLRVFSPSHSKDDGRATIWDSELVDTEPEGLYRSYLVDGLPEMDHFSGDVRSFPFSMRRKRFRKFHSRSKVGMTGELYALLSHQYAARKEMIDMNTCTFLDGEDVMVIPEYDGINLVYGSGVTPVYFRDLVPPKGQISHVPIGRSSNGRPMIEWISETDCLPDFDLTRGRFRRVLGGNLVQMKE